MKKVSLACIIDDDPIFVYGTRKMMQLANCCENFMVFQNGEMALENLTSIIASGKGLPEIILLDINMPIMDGWQFLDKFTKIKTPQKITIYIVTSSIDPADQEKAKTYDGIENFVVKPINVDMVKVLCDLP